MLETRRSSDLFPSAVVQTTTDGHGITLISHPYTDGYEIFVLARTVPNDLSSWREYRIDEIIVPNCHETPAALVDSNSRNSTRTEECLGNSPARLLSASSSVATTARPRFELRQRLSELRFLQRHVSRKLKTSRPCGKIRRRLFWPDAVQNVFSVRARSRRWKETKRVTEIATRPG